MSSISLLSCLYNKVSNEHKIFFTLKFIYQILGTILVLVYGWSIFLEVLLWESGRYWILPEEKNCRSLGRVEVTNDFSRMNSHLITIHKYSRGKDPRTYSLVEETSSQHSCGRVKKDVGLWEGGNSIPGDPATLAQAVPSWRWPWAGSWRRCVLIWMWFASQSSCIPSVLMWEHTSRIFMKWNLVGGNLVPMRHRSGKRLR